MTTDGAPRENNSVYLRGRIAAAHEVKDLPSGDEMAVFRLTVDRPPGERVRVDSLECTSIVAKVHRSLARVEPGDVVEVTGRLRRRFWRGPGGLGSRYAVDVQSLRVLDRRGRVSAGRSGAAGRGRTRASA